MKIHHTISSMLPFSCLDSGTAHCYVLWKSPQLAIGATQAGVTLGSSVAGAARPCTGPGSGEADWAQRSPGARHQGPEACSSPAVTLSSSCARCLPSPPRRVLHRLRLRSCLPLGAAVRALLRVDRPGQAPAREAMANPAPGRRP